MRYDVIVVGGSFAGLSAAMQLARARRPVCVVDAGAPRNRFAAESHGFFGQDGAPPLAMIEQARRCLLAYPSVSFVAGRVASAAADATGPGFSVLLDDGARLSSRYVVLAFGIEDVLPDIEGLQSRWGISVLHCPYCHGYEFGGQRLGVLGAGPPAVHHAQLIADWGTVTLFLDGGQLPDAEDRARLAARGIAVEPGRIAALEGEMPALAGARMADGRRVPLDALYVGPRARMGSTLADQLGCAFDEGWLGPVIRTDPATKMTTVPGVYAAGDAATLRQNATLASADGVLAGAAVHQALVFGTAA